MIDTATWVHWEIARYLMQSEAPGKFGYFTKEDAK